MIQADGAGRKSTEAAVTESAVTDGEAGEIEAAGTEGVGTEAEVVIVPYRNGPLIVRGPVTFRDQDGNPIDAGRSPVALCRCGRSRIRPFCDGTHATTRFRAPSGRENRAVQP